MGQRHQVYVRLPKKFYNNGNPNNKKEKNIGIHHHWLYGITAIRLLRNYLKFQENVEPHSLDFMREDYNALEILKGCYSLDIEKGYYHGVHELTDEVNDPLLGDNNNGVTVIDFSKEKIKYCFLSIGGLQCLDEDIDIQQDNWKHGNVEKPAYINFYPINAQQWLNLHYSENTLRSYDKKDREELHKILTHLKKYEVLTLKDLIRIFPKLKNEFLKAEEIHDSIQPNSIKFIRDKK